MEKSKIVPFFFLPPTVEFPPFRACCAGNGAFPRRPENGANSACDANRGYFPAIFFPPSCRISAGISTLRDAGVLATLLRAAQPGSITAVFSQRWRIGFRGDFGSFRGFGECSRGTERGGEYGERRFGLCGGEGFPRGGEMCGIFEET